MRDQTSLLPEDPPAAGAPPHVPIPPGVVPNVGGIVGVTTVPPGLSF